MGMTIAEKILAQHSGQREVGPGDVVVVDVDVILDLDLGFIIQGIHPIPTRVAAPEKIVIEGIDPLIDKMDEVIDMLLETRPRRNVQAPPRPKPDLPPPTSPRPQPSIRTGKGGVQLP